MCTCVFMLPNLGSRFPNLSLQGARVAALRGDSHCAVENDESNAIKPERSAFTTTRQPGRDILHYRRARCEANVSKD